MLLKGLWKAFERPLQGGKKIFQGLSFDVEAFQGLVVEGLIVEGLLRPMALLRRLMGLRGEDRESASPFVRTKSRLQMLCSHAQNAL